MTVMLEDFDSAILKTFINLNFIDYYFLLLTLLLLLLRLHLPTMLAYLVRHCTNREVQTLLLAQGLDSAGHTVPGLGNGSQLQEEKS